VVDLTESAVAQIATGQRQPTLNPERVNPRSAQRDRGVAHGAWGWALIMSGQREAGFAEDAFQAIDLFGDRSYEAELHRIKGSLLLELGGDRRDEAGACLERALELSRAQGARLYELRATTSLARQLAKQGKRDEARAMLAEIYNWFTEGFDTADLKDAKALLEELSP
jgi:tetratricopeptide (TPR) repeat protein